MSREVPGHERRTWRGHRAQNSTRPAEPRLVASRGYGLGTHGVPTPGLTCPRTVGQGVTRLGGRSAPDAAQVRGGQDSAPPGSPAPGTPLAVSQPTSRSGTSRRPLACRRPAAPAHSGSGSQLWPTPRSPHLHCRRCFRARPAHGGQKPRPTAGSPAPNGRKRKYMGERTGWTCRGRAKGPRPAAAPAGAEGERARLSARPRAVPPSWASFVARDPTHPL